MAVQGVAQPFGIPAGPLYQCLDAVIAGIQQCQQQMTRLKLVVPMSYRQGLCVGDATLQFGSELVETHSVSSIGGGGRCVQTHRLGSHCTNAYASESLRCAVLGILTYGYMLRCPVLRAPCASSRSAICSAVPSPCHVVLTSSMESGWAAFKA